jgi:hypothetical protein
MMGAFLLHAYSPGSAFYQTARGSSRSSPDDLQYRHDFHGYVAAFSFATLMKVLAYSEHLHRRLLLLGELSCNDLADVWRRCCRRPGVMRRYDLRRTLVMGLILGPMAEQYS